MTISEQLKIMDETKHELLCMKEVVTTMKMTLDLLEDRIRKVAYKLNTEVMKQAVE